jgi:transposase-like protein
MALRTEQYEAIALLALPKEQRPTIAEIAKKVGVGERTIYDWKRNETFQTELKREITRNTQARLPELMEALIDHGIGGNAAAAKLILQANGMLTEKVEMNTTVTDGSGDVDALKARLAEMKRNQSASDAETA